MIFKTLFIRSDRIHSLKCIRSMALGCKDIGISKSECVSTTPILIKRIIKFGIINPGYKTWYYYPGI